MLVLASAEGVAAITVGGALVVAIITAITTNRRQREALNHDREVTDLADLRVLLDEAAVAMWESHDAFDNLWKRFREHGNGLSDVLREKLADRGRVMLALSARLNVRLGENAPVALAFTRANKEMLDTWHQVQPAKLTDANDDLVAEKLVAIEASKKSFEEAWMLLWRRP